MRLLLHFHSHDGNGHTHDHADSPGHFHERERPLDRDFNRRAFTVGVGGPVGSGKTALMLQLCKRLLQPTIRELAGDRKLPHVFRGVGDPLCLFYAPAREWNSSMLIARTIVPWTCEWLFHFEAWLFTGKWDGGGVHHDPETQHVEIADRSIRQD